MRMIVVFAAAAGLAACGPGETEPQSDEMAYEEPEAESEVLSIDGKPAHGSYRVTGPDGTTSTEVLNPDGTYMSTRPDGTVENGRWVQKAPDTFCSTPDTEGAVEACYSETIDENGVWTATGADGATYTVERVES
jgi:hypothetical protein